MAAISKSTQAAPALVFPWKDEETDACGWVVFDKVINSVCGGGIFMHANATEQETADIARNMTRKFTVCAPQIGGAKAGIRFDHRDPRAESVLRRFIQANKQILRTSWVTAGDLNTDDAFIERVCQEDIGLATCQGTLGRRFAEETGGVDRSTALARFIPMPACKYFPLIEAAVGYGLAATMEKAFALDGISGIPRVIIQGFGAVGSSLAYYLVTKKIATVVAIADRDGYVHSSNGLPIELFLQQRQDHAIQDAYHAKNLLCNLSDAQLEQFNAFKRPKEDNHVKFMQRLISCEEAEVISPCAIRYQITEDVIAAAVNGGCWTNGDTKRYLIGGANNILGYLGQRGVLREDTSGAVENILQENAVVHVPDWVANSGTAQLFHRVLSVPFDENATDVAADVLEACAAPIRSFLDHAFEKNGGRIIELANGCERLAQERITNPIPFHVTSKHRSPYALPAMPTLPRGEERFAALSPLFQECLTEEDLRALCEDCPNPVAYDGFEPSGRMHVAQGLMKAHIVNRMTENGFTFLFWVADWFAKLNNKMGGNMDDIQTAGRYFVEIWKASGMNMDRVRFLWASEEFEKRSDTYWPLVLDISTKNSLARIKKCTQIMGRKNEAKLTASQIFYPCMQCADIFFLGVDVCQLGMDQRKVNVLAREYAAQTQQPAPVILSHHMLPGLKKGQNKMSKSNADSALFMEDSPEEIYRKIKAAYCPPPVSDKEEEGKVNPCLAYFQHIVFPALRSATFCQSSLALPTHLKAKPANRFL